MWYTPFSLKNPGNSNLQEKILSQKSEQRSRQARLFFMSDG
jgi:hypothetical protein